MIRSRFKSRWRILVVAAAALLLLLAALPWIVAVTPLRNALIQAVVRNPDLRLSADRASFGWLSPLSLDGLRVEHERGTFRAEVQRVSAERPWWRLALSRPQLGRLQLDRPSFRLVISEPDDPTSDWELIPAEGKPVRADFTAVVNDAQFAVIAAPSTQPVIDVEGIDLTLSVRQAESGRVLTIEPATVFDHEELTPELCEQGLQLVAPILADATRVEGQISLEVRRFVAPLDGPEPGGGIQQAEVDGVLVLHGVTAGLKSPILQAVARLLSTLLGVDAIDQVRILDESKVEFHLAEGRLHHEGLSFVFPDLSEALLVTSRGSVGLDETLDLVVEIPLPLTLVHDGPITRRLSARPLGLNIRGTLDEPRIELPADRQPWWELADALLREDAGSGEPAPVDAILDAVGRWLQPPTTEGSEGERPLLEGLLNRWQQRREDLRGRPGGRPADRPLLRGLFPPRAP